MLSTQSIDALSTTRQDLYAFRVHGRVTRAHMNAMARHISDACNAHEHVDMLLYFNDFEGSEPDAGSDMDSAKSMFQSLSSVRRYVVANAPGTASDMVDALGKILPAETERFDDLDEAFDALDAKSMTKTGKPAAQD